MRIHLYAQCWNDEWMLPYFFRHYDGLVDRYFIFDDGSTDASLALLRAHPKVVVERFERKVADSFVLSELAFSNEAWKASRGQADWVIMTDLDEHLCHPDLHAYLARLESESVTVVPALGYQMISEVLPGAGDRLCDTITRGAPWVQMMKPSLFNPDAIREISYTPGRHKADPAGDVRVPATDELLLLHYKYIGLQRTHARHQLLRTGLREGDARNGWAHKYRWSFAQLQDDWKEVAAQAVDTRSVRSDPGAHYPLPRWWEKYRAGAAAA